MIRRIGDQIRTQQRHEEVSGSISRSNIDVPPIQDMRHYQIPSTPIYEHQTSHTIEARYSNGAEDFSLELDDLWNMVVSSDEWMTQEAGAT